MEGVFKAYESKETAKEVAKIKQKTSNNQYWTVIPTHLVLSQALK